MCLLGKNDWETCGRSSDRVELKDIIIPLGVKTPGKPPTRQGTEKRMWSKDLNSASTEQHVRERNVQLWGVAK